MKRILALLMIAALLMPLAACTKPDPEQVQDAGIEASAAAADDPDWDPLAAVELPRPDPNVGDDPSGDDQGFETPITSVDLTDYTYETCENDELNVRFKYPSHWTNVPGQNTICYEEPVEPGQIGARLAITVKSAGNVVVTEWLGMDKLTKFSKVIKENVKSFKMRKRGRQKISKNTAFNFTYTAVMDEVPIKGFCALVYNPKTNLFTVFHWYTTTDRYNNFEPIRKTIVKSIKC